MSDLQILRELAGQVLPPQFDDLIVVARKRRRRSSLVAAAGMAVLGLGATFAAATLSDGERVIEPAPAPTPSDGWTPDRIRAEGTSDVLVSPTESGLTVRQYQACDGEPPCREVHLALEVAQDGRSAVFDVQGELPSFVPVWVEVHDDDSVLVQDATDPQSDGPVRYRLLQAGGGEVELRLVDEPAPAVPGPDVHVIDDYAGWTRGMSPVQDVFLVDEAAGTLRPLDVPDETVDYWVLDSDTFLWGVTGDCRAYWTTGDGLEEKDLDCVEGPMPLDLSWYPEGWLRPGRMAVAELYDVPADGREDVNDMTLHVSLDSGATWETLEVGRYDDETWMDKLAGALRGLG